jgi:hypothetical protein
LIATLLLSDAASAAGHQGVNAMNNASVWRGVAIAVLVIAAAALVGVGAYNEGVAHGLAQGGAIAAAPPAGAPYAYGYRPWGGGVFPLFPLFFMLFLFFCLRGFLWRGPWHGGWRHRYYDGVPPMFEEWHRRAHAQSPPSRPPDA